MAKSIFPSVGSRITLLTSLILPRPLQPPADSLIPHSQLTLFRALPQTIFSTVCEGLRLTFWQDSLQCQRWRALMNNREAGWWQITVMKNRNFYYPASITNLHYNRHFMHQARLWYLSYFGRLSVFISKNPILSLLHPPLQLSMWPQTLQREIPWQSESSTDITNLFITCGVLLVCKI